MFKYLLWLFAVMPSCVIAAQSKVITDIGLSGVSIRAITAVNADRRVLWDTLTDYNRLAAFVPGMTLSRQISPANARTKQVEQRGEGGLLAMVLPDHVIMELDEQPYSRIGFRSVSGGLSSMQGEWVILGEQAPVTLGYRARVVTALPPPPVLTEDYIREEIRLRMEAVAREAERRMRLGR
ncbi:SRPBCC family protein [Parasulfuritortus cantonensis]|nr:SRPBCC family protein [Parasulfuritortus cantonensis]